jgi:ATP-dependent Clp protease ATP-binding subunit ClpC
MNWFKSFWKKLTGPAPAGAVFLDESIVNFTPRTQQVLALTRLEASRIEHSSIDTEHVLLGMIKLQQGVGVNVLQRMGLNLETVRLEIEKRAGTGYDPAAKGPIPYTPRVKKVLALALQEARALHHTYVGTEHILLGLLREGDGVAAHVLKQFKVDLEQTRKEILRELDPNIRPGDSEPGEETTNHCW